jgi:hypothetical protein
LWGGGGGGRPRPPPPPPHPPIPIPIKTNKFKLFYKYLNKINMKFNENCVSVFRGYFKTMLI